MTIVTAIISKIIERRFFGNVKSALFDKRLRSCSACALCTQLLHEIKPENMSAHRCNAIFDIICLSTQIQKFSVLCINYLTYNN